MSLLDYQAAKSLIEKFGGDFDGPKPESLVASAERALNLKFPPSYRRFLLELGCGNINGLEFLGVINEDFENACMPDAIWCTLVHRKEVGLNPAYVLIADADDGAYDAIDTAIVDETGESPVVRIWEMGMWDVSIDPKPLAPDFGAYLLAAVQSVT